METDTRSRIVYLDMLRIIACLLVIAVHVSSKQIYVFPPDSFDFQVSQFFNTFSIAAPAIFFMISGAVFLKPGLKDIPVKKLWGRYILRMVIAYVFWSYLYTFITWFPYYTFSLETLKAFILEFFNGVPMYHMWFIPVIIAIYMVLPFLKPAFADKQRCRYYLWLFLAVQILIPTVFKFDIPHGHLLQAIYTRIPYFLCTGHVGYFVLGYYLSTEEFSRNKRRAIYALGILGLAAAAGMDGYFSVRQNKPVLLFDELFSLNTFLLAAALFVAFRYISWKEEGLFAKCAARVSKLTFGIYLIHPLFMDLLFDHCPFLLHLPAIVWIPVIAIAAFAASLAAIWIVSKIPIVNKYLM